MFCWGCSIPEVYGPIVDLMDYIDGEGAYYQCDPSPMGACGGNESGHARGDYASDRKPDAKSEGGGDDGLEDVDAAPKSHEGGGECAFVVGTAHWFDVIHRARSSENARSCLAFYPVPLAFLALRPSSLIAFSYPTRSPGGHILTSTHAVTHLKCSIFNNNRLLMLESSMDFTWVISPNCVEQRLKGIKEDAL
jgi:hypothetical protein